MNTWVKDITNELMRFCDAEGKGTAEILTICEVTGRVALLNVNTAVPQIDSISTCDAYALVLTQLKVDHWVSGPYEQQDLNGELYESYYLHCPHDELCSRVRIEAHADESLAVGPSLITNLDYQVEV